jgi:DNA-binding NarL/FixJ family response regulator
MTRVLLAAPQPDIRKALWLLLRDLHMEVVGETADWPATLDLSRTTRPDMVLVDWELIPVNSGGTVAQLRLVCPAAAVIVLISHLGARQQAALSAGADAFISKGEMPDRIAEHLRAAAQSILSSS